MEEIKRQLSLIGAELQRIICGYFFIFLNLQESLLGMMMKKKKKKRKKKDDNDNDCDCWQKDGKLMDQPNDDMVPERLSVRHFLCVCFPLSVYARLVSLLYDKNNWG